MKSSTDLRDEYRHLIWLRPETAYLRFVSFSVSVAIEEEEKEMGLEWDLFDSEVRGESWEEYFYTREDDNQRVVWHFNDNSKIIK